MRTFNDLNNIWNRQSFSNSNTSAQELIKKADVQTKMIKVKHRWTIGILSITTAILIVYFVWIEAFKMKSLALGLGIMIGMVLFRFILELVSTNKFKSIKLDSSLVEYSHKMRQFYNWRKKIHSILTPIIYFAYIGGLFLLLPVFKQNFSQGMYHYILVSGFSFLMIFSFFIIRQIRSEMRLLNYLKNIR